MSLFSNPSLCRCIYRQVFIGNDDSEVEGVWENWYTDQASPIITNFCPFFGNGDSSACGIPTMGSRPTLRWRDKVQLHADQGHFHLQCNIICSSTSGHSQEHVSTKYTTPLPLEIFQVDLEDSGTTLATTTNPTINDEKCNRGYCSLCEVAAPVRRVTVRGLCELSMFDRYIALRT